jgi:hypothetical protein
VASDVPPGAVALSVSGGHNATVYYVVCVNNGIVTIHRHDQGQQGWVRLDGIGAAVQQPNAMYGPLHVNPFDPNHVFVLTADGVRVTRGALVQAQTVFDRDATLTQLLTESGTYATDLVFAGCNGDRVVGCSQAGAFPKQIISNMAFRRGPQPSVIVGSPVAGLFYAVDETRQWLSLGSSLPTPFTMISDVAYDGVTAYASFEGRGVWRFVSPEGAPPACWFAPGQQNTDKVAVLTRTDGLSAANLSVQAIVSKDGAETVQQITTDNAGAITVPNAVGKVVHLRFAGNEDVAPCGASVRR